MRKLALALLAAMIALPAQALDEPRSSKFDNRIRYTIYNPRDVVQLDAVIGIATHIVLEENGTSRTLAAMRKPGRSRWKATTYSSSRERITQRRT